MDGIFTDGRDGMGYLKGPLNFHFLSIYMMLMSTHIYIYIYILKDFHQDSYGFYNAGCRH